MAIHVQFFVLRKRFNVVEVDYHQGSSFVFVGVDAPWRKISVLCWKQMQKAIIQKKEKLVQRTSGTFPNGQAEKVRRWEVRFSGKFLRSGEAVLYELEAIGSWSVQKRHQFQLASLYFPLDWMKRSVLRTMLPPCRASPAADIHGVHPDIASISLVITGYRISKLANMVGKINGSTVVYLAANEHCFST